MEAKILEFCRLLRRGGIVVSFTQVMDALQAVSEVGFDWDDFYIAMRSILIADHAEQSLFDRLFRLYFRSLHRLPESPENMQISPENSDGQFASVADLAQSADGAGMGREQEPLRLYC